MSTAQLSVIIMFLVTVSCQKQQSPETLKSVENVIITLEEYGVFTCEILGKYNDLKIRIDNGIQESSLVDPARGYFISLDNSTMNKTLAIQKVNITIKGLERNNNSLVECYDNTIGRHKTPKATLLIKDGPAKPNVKYIVAQEIVQLSWPHPANWMSYTITGYHTLCRDSNNMLFYDKHINDTVSGVVSVTVELPRVISDCYIIYCNVSASNELDTTTTITNKSLLMRESSETSILVVRTFLLEKEMMLLVCVQLPIMCSFQTLDYTITIFDDDDKQVTQWAREFSSSNGSNSECIEEAVNDKLEQSREYTVLVTVYNDEERKYTVSQKTLTPKLSEGSALSADSEDDNNSGVVVDIAMGIMLLIVIVILIIFACIIIGMCRALKSFRRFGNDGQRTPGATNRVFEAYSSLAKIDSESPQKKPDPVYHTLEAPPTTSSNNNDYHNQTMSSQEPVYHNPLPVKKKKNSTK